MRTSTRGLLLLGMVIALYLLTIPAYAKDNKKIDDTAKLRADYIARLQQQVAPVVNQQPVGSLWSNSFITQLGNDYKAHALNDTLVIQVSVQTTATQSADVTSQRTFQTSSAITGLAGGIPTHGVNPLLNANSNTQLKGQGQTDANTVLQTNLTATVIAVLTNGNLVVEAQRQIFMNNQHENVIVRGVVRQGDISPLNTIASSQLSNLEIEMKGKGIISDSTRPPHRLTRAVLWLFGF